MGGRDVCASSSVCVSELDAFTMLSYHKCEPGSAQAFRDIFLYSSQKKKSYFFCGDSVTFLLVSVVLVDILQLE